MLLYTNKLQAVAWLKSTVAIADTDSTKLEEILEAFTWVVGGVTFYRVHITLAKVLWLLPRNNLLRADSIQYDQNTTTARRLCEEQVRVDKDNNLGIPPNHPRSAELFLGEILSLSGNPEITKGIWINSAVLDGVIWEAWS